MKNNYRKLKLKILWQAVFATALTIVVGYILVNVLLEDSSNELVRILTSIHMQEEEARAWYWRVIGNNKEIVMAIGFLALFSAFFYVALAKLEKYLKQIEQGINNIASDSKESIDMIPELQPVETRLREIKQTLKKKEQEANEAEQKKNDLVVYLAHDLKTPLTSIVAYLTMLDSYKDMPEAERAHYTRVALDKSVRLDELINEFFDIIKFNLQDIELEKSALNLSMMLEQIADEFYGVFQKKNLRCELEVAEGLMIDGDSDKLARVFDNILRNAVSYCYENSVIQICATETNGQVLIEFKNQGDCIPQEKLKTIFEKFYRLDDARRSRTGGAGLGLAIAKKIVELHGGVIRAQSENSTTSFMVALPQIERNEGKTGWK